MKEVGVDAHSFDCLPGHVSVSGHGKGSSLQVAVCDAIRDMLSSPLLFRKHVHSFKLSVVVMKNQENP